MKRTQRSIALDNKTVEYALTVNPRSKRVRLAIRHDGTVAVSTPRFVPQSFVENFMMSKAGWILEKIDFFKEVKKNAPAEDGGVGDRARFAQYKEQALRLVLSRSTHYNQVYNFTWNRVTIKNQKTRWGSCSKQGNLNFNYKIALLPPHLADYIIVHELCHLKELNHGKNFWNLVGKTIPNHLELRKELRKSGLSF